MPLTRLFCVLFIAYCTLLIPADSAKADGLFSRIRQERCCRKCCKTTACCSQGYCSNCCSCPTACFASSPEVTYSHAAPSLVDPETLYPVTLLMVGEDGREIKLRVPTSQMGLLQGILTGRVVEKNP